MIILFSLKRVTVPAISLLKVVSFGFPASTRRIILLLNFVTAPLFQGLQALKAVPQQQIDAIQSGIDSNNQRIQQIDAEIECLQNQIEELNNM